MANSDRPMGFVPVGHMSGGEIRARAYTMDDAQTIYKGDLVITDFTGRIKIGAAAAANTVAQWHRSVRAARWASTHHLLCSNNELPMIVCTREHVTQRWIASSSRVTWGSGARHSTNKRNIIANYKQSTSFNCSQPDWVVIVDALSKFSNKIIPRRARVAWSSTIWLLLY